MTIRFSPKLAALMLAAASGQRAVVDRLVRGDVRIAAKNEAGLTAAELARQAGHLEVAKHLDDEAEKRGSLLGIF